MSLAQLEHTVARDLALTAHPRQPWLRPRTFEGTPVLDVLVVGAGQCGLATGFALQRDQVTNTLLVDAAPEGREGPWTTYARMPALRSAKDQTGPDAGQPGLTYQAWHEAQWGAAHFAAIPLIPKESWAAYLSWFRRVTALPIRNGAAVVAIAPRRTDDGLPCLQATLSTGEPLLARKVVLATGQDGTGRWSDRHPPAAADGHLGAFPYLDRDYAFTERAPGLTPWIADLHLFGIGTSLSFGPAGSSISAMSSAVPKLVAGITRGLFRANLQDHWQALQGYDVKQVDLSPAHQRRYDAAAE